MIKKLERVLVITNDPHSNRSYGIIANYLMKSTCDTYEWHVMPKERSSGKPIDMGYYTMWYSGKTAMQRNFEVMPAIMDKIKPRFFITIEDLDQIYQIWAAAPKDLPWIHYFPIDNHDVVALKKTKPVIDRADVSVVMSQFGLKLAAKYNVKIDRCIYPFIDTKAYHPFKKKSNLQTVKKYKQDCKMEENDKLLLWVGRPGWRKNLQFLLGAFAEICRKRNDVHLHLHTDFNDPAREMDIRKGIYAHGIPKEKIHSTIGHEHSVGVPQLILASLYNACDVYVSTHGGEGFGMPIVEAMACGKPFVCTNNTTTSEFGRDEDGEWVRGLGAKIAAVSDDHNVQRPYVDIPDFCDKVEQLLDDESLRLDMGKKGIKWANDNCSVPVIAEKWKQLFREIDVPRITITGEYN